MNKLEHFLNETQQGHISRKIKFDIDVVSTQHAVERLNRKKEDGTNAYEPVEFKEVNSIINKATPDIIDDLVKDTMDINKDRFVLQRESDGLTVVGVMNNTKDKLSFVVITLFRGSHFKVGRDQKIIKV